MNLEQANKELSLGETARRQFQHQSAIECFRRAEKALSVGDLELVPLDALTLLAVVRKNLAELMSGIEPHDLSHIDRANEVFEKLSSRGVKTYEKLQADLYHTAGEARLSSYTSAAVKLLTHSVGLYESFVANQQTQEVCLHYGKALYHRALALQKLGELEEASLAYIRAESQFQADFDRYGDSRLMQLAATCAQNLANVYEQSNHTSKAITACARAVQRYEQLITSDHWECFPPLAEVLMNLSMAHWYNKEREQALQIGKRAAIFFEAIVGRWHMGNCETSRRKIHHHLRSMGYREDKTSSVTKAIELAVSTLATDSQLSKRSLADAEQQFEESDKVKRNDKLLETFAEIARKIAEAQKKQGDLHQAMATLEESLVKIKQQIHLGWFHLVDQDYTTHMLLGQWYQLDNQHTVAQSHLQQSLDRLLPLNNPGNRGHLALDIAIVRYYQALSYVELNQPELAKQSLSSSYQILEALKKVGLKTAIPHIAHVRALSEKLGP